MVDTESDREKVFRGTNGTSHGDQIDSVNAFTTSFIKNGDSGDNSLHDSIGHAKKVTFSETEPQRNGRPSVPGSSALYQSSYDNPPLENYGENPFVEDMSRKMRVPHQIRPYDDDSAHFLMPADSFSKGNAAARMSVPDRILVAGHDQHVGLREQRPRELDFDDMLYGFRTEAPVAVQTPPRTLTVDQHTFPSAEVTNQMSEGPIIAPFSASALSHHPEQSLHSPIERNGFSASRPPRSAARISAPPTPSALRAQLPDTPASRLVVDLYKRVEILERENHRRYLREMLGYALLIGFVAMKGASFFLKR